MVFTIIGILVAVILVIRIVQILEDRSRTLVPPPEDRGPVLFDPVDYGKAEEGAAKTPTCWVNFAGTSPPTKLLLRPVSEEVFAAFGRKELSALGLARDSMDVFLPIVTARAMAEAYVVDWSGPTYENGNAMPYSAQNLVGKILKDEHLSTFISDSVKELRSAG